MTDGQHGMAPYHPRSGKPHDRLDAFAHRGIIAMHGALIAHRLFTPERTLLNPFPRIT